MIDGTTVTRTRMCALVVALWLAALPIERLANGGPFVELPEEHETLEHELLRGLRDLRLNSEGTTLGGYGQFQLNSLKVGPEGDWDNTATVRRLILFAAHRFNENFRTYIELEWENAIACSTCRGSVEVEQGFVDWLIRGDRFGLRAGLVLIPMGIINQWHEPSVFHGVDRPRVDQLVIPSTWRELGAGIFGTINAPRGTTARYELYLTTTFDPAALGPGGLADARTNGSLAPGNGWMFSGRAEWEPRLGVLVGASFAAGEMGGNVKLFDAAGQRNALSLPLVGLSADARVRLAGWEARAVWAEFFMPQSDELIAARRADGSPLFPNVAATGPVPTRVRGAYVEAAYDVFHPFQRTRRTGHQLLPFARLEYYNTQAGVPESTAANPQLRVWEVTTGVSYRPIPQVVLKADLQLRDRQRGNDERGVNVGMGYMF